MYSSKLLFSPYFLLLGSSGLDSGPWTRTVSQRAHSMPTNTYCQVTSQWFVVGVLSAALWRGLLVRWQRWIMKTHCNHALFLRTVPGHTAPPGPFATRTALGNTVTVTQIRLKHWHTALACSVLSSFDSGGRTSNSCRNICHDMALLARLISSALWLHCLPLLLLEDLSGMTAVPFGDVLAVLPKFPGCPGWGCQSR